MAGLAQVIAELLRLCEIDEGDRVILYTSEEYDQPLLTEYARALKSVSADYMRVIAPVRDVGGQLVNAGGGRMAASLFREADLVIYVLPPTAYWRESVPRVAQLHTEAFKKVRAANPTLRWLQVGVPFPEINYRRLFPTKERDERTKNGAKVLSNAGEIRLRSKAGTDFRCRKDGLAAEYHVGYVTPGHTWDNFGLGTIVTHPLESSADGVIVVAPGDHWHHTNSPEDLSIVRKAVRLNFEKGLLVGIGGGAEASLIRRAFARYENESVYRLSHIGWGTNEKCVWVEDRCFCVADWESMYGSVMVHFGGYAGEGGPHMSGPTILDHTLELDGEVIVSGNEIIHSKCR